MNVTIHTGNLYYDMPLNLYNRTNLNRAVGVVVKVWYYHKELSITEKTLPNKEIFQ